MKLFSNPRRLAILAGAMFASAMPMTSASAAGARPTIVLVHGAFADSSSWDGVIAALQKDGDTVIAAANQLRSVKSDADSVARVVKNVPGPLVLVGHSHGGAVFSAPARQLYRWIVVPRKLPAQHGGLTPTTPGRHDGTSA